MAWGNIQQTLTVITSLFNLACLFFIELLGHSLSYFPLSFPFLSFPNFFLLHLLLSEPLIRLCLLQTAHPIFTSQQLLSSSCLFITLSCLSSGFENIFFAFPSLTAWTISLLLFSVVCSKIPTHHLLLCFQSPMTSLHAFGYFCCFFPSSYLSFSSGSMMLFSYAYIFPLPL